MNVTVIPANQLSDLQCAQWTRLQRCHPGLANPNFCPEFTLAVADVRPDIRVAVLHEAGETFGFLPFHQARGRVGQPLAEFFSDFQAVIGAPELTCDAADLVRQAGLSAWRFESLLVSQQMFAKYHWSTAGSPYMDLSSGFDAYRVERRRAGSDELREALRKSRKIEREIGPLRFEPLATDPEALNTLIAWKQQQLAASRLPDCFTPPWVLPLLRRIVSTRTASFSGMLSTLHVGDELAAVNLGMRAGRVLHGWVTAFNRRYAKYSPGLMLITRLAQAAESLGIERIDMGAGNESFKRSFASGAVAVAKGSIELQPLSRAWRCGWRGARGLVLGSSLAEPARNVLSRIRRVTGDR